MKFDLYEKMELSTEDDLYFLKLFSKYGNDLIRPDFYYEDYNSKELTKLRESFDLRPLLEGENELKKLFDLKKWAYDYLSFKGDELGSKKYDYLDVLDIVNVAKAEGHSLNCRYISLIFTLVLLSLGFKARLVSCMSMDLRYNECHWITEVYIKKLSKWIIVDVPLNLFYFDRRGNFLNLIEMRRMIIAGENIRFFSSNREHVYFVQDYWKKNVFRFKFLLENKYQMLSSSNTHFYILNPVGFTQKDKTIYLENRRTTIQYVYNDKIFWEEL